MNWAWRGMADALNSCGAGVDAMLSVQRSFMYFPTQDRPSPSDAGVPEMRQVTLHTADGLDLVAWYAPPTREGAPTLIYFHGNGGDIGMRAGKVSPFLDAGLGVLLTTYRGYSGNPGTPSETGLYADARAARAFLEAQNTSAIALYGESLGTGVAVQLATEMAPLAVVLEAPFTSIADLAQPQMPFLPVKALILDRFDSAAKIGEISAPLLIVHGALDATIPVQLARQLFEAAPEPKEGHFLPGAGHHDLFGHGMAALTLTFLEKNAG